VSQLAIQNFETQKILQVANNETMSDEDKVEIFRESFSKLSKVTLGMVAASIYKVDTSQGSTEDFNFIKEFMENVDKEIFNVVQKHLETLKDQNSVKPVIIPVTEELRAQGFTGETIEVPLTFDAASFFA
jgi:hypothetical protein